jgi:hypothetical protein
MSPWRSWAGEREGAVRSGPEEKAVNTKTVLIPTFLTLLIAACSKSPVERGVEATTGLIKQAMAPIYPKDASAQAERMVLLLADRPECDVYKAQLRDAGRGPPTEGTTQRNLVVAYDAAGKAGRVKTVK